MEQPTNITSTENRIMAMEQKINAIYTSVEKSRKYFKWTLIITVVLFVLPLIGLALAIPAFMSQYSDIAKLGL